MKHPRESEMDYIDVALFERDGKPWISFNIVTVDGAERLVETELDVTHMRIRFGETKSRYIPLFELVHTRKVKAS